MATTSIGDLFAASELGELGELGELVSGRSEEAAVRTLSMVLKPSREGMCVALVVAGSCELTELTQLTRQVVAR